jgi:hypothetical protein
MAAEGMAAEGMLAEGMAAEGMLAEVMLPAAPFTGGAAAVMWQAGGVDTFGTAIGGAMASGFAGDGHQLDTFGFAE